ncbi:MAG: hypothetical protein QXS32_08460 [Candidatus Nezhaarchaeales archaeon]
MKKVKVHRCESDGKYFIVDVELGRWTLRHIVNQRDLKRFLKGLK